VTPAVSTRVRNRRGRAPAAGADLPVEDQTDLVRAAEVEVLPDHLLEQHPPAGRPVEHLGQTELRLQDRDVIPVAGGPVCGGERVRQDPQPLAQQGVDLRRAQPAADRLQPGRVVAGGEPVVQRGEPHPGPARLPFGPLVPIEAQLGVVREVGAELQEERAEVGVHAVDVELVDHPGARHDPRVGRAGDRVAPLLCPEHPGLLLRSPDEQHPFRAGEPGQVLGGDVVLALTLGELDQRHVLVPAEPVDRRDEALADRVHQRRGRERRATVPAEEAHHTSRVLQPGLVDVQVHPVDALHLQRHMTGENISGSAGYRHHKLRSQVGPTGPPNRHGGPMTGSTLPV